MKANKLFVLFLCLVSCMVASAQDYNIKKFQLQVRGGMNISTVSMDYDNRYESERPRVGYNIGAVVDIALGKNIYIQPGLVFTAKGSQLRDMPVDVGGRVDLSMNALYLQMPVYVAYKIPIGYWANSFNIAAGPYFAYGVGGKITGRGVYDADTFGDNGLANRPDVGLGMEIQFEMPKVVFLSGFETGFARMMKRDYFYTDIRSFNMYFGMGYKF